MRKDKFISYSSLNSFEILRWEGSPCHTYYDTIKIFLMTKKLANVQVIFAFPKLTRIKANQIEGFEWKAELNSSHPLKCLGTMIDDDKREGLRKQYEKFKTAIIKLKSSKDEDLRYWGQLLHDCIAYVTDSDIYTNGEKLIITGWGIKPYGQSKEDTPPIKTFKTDKPQNLRTDKPRRIGEEKLGETGLVAPKNNTENKEDKTTYKAIKPHKPQNLRTDKSPPKGKKDFGETGLDKPNKNTKAFICSLNSFDVLFIDERPVHDYHLMIQEYFSKIEITGHKLVFGSPSSIKNNGSFQAISWTLNSYPEKLIPLDSLEPKLRNDIINGLKGIEKLAEQLLTKNDEADKKWGELIIKSVQYVDYSSILKGEKKIIIIRWGQKPKGAKVEGPFTEIIFNPGTKSTNTSSKKLETDHKGTKKTYIGKNVKQPSSGMEGRKKKTHRRENPADQAKKTIRKKHSPKKNEIVEGENLPPSIIIKGVEKKLPDKEITYSGEKPIEGENSVTPKSVENNGEREKIYVRRDKYRRVFWLLIFISLFMEIVLFLFLIFKQSPINEILTK